jgi:hypothetical protein
MHTALTETSAAKRLATLAVLRAHWSEGEQSYIDTFLPFALEAVRLEGGNELALASICERMDVEFGIKLPVATLQKVLQGARQKNLGTIRNGRFLRQSGSLDQFDTAAARQTARREHLSLIDRLVQVAEAQGLNWSAEDAADAIADYLDRHATSLLAAGHGHDLDPVDIDDGDPREFVVASCFSVILEKEPEAAAYVEHLVVGTMLASALYTPDMDRIADPLTCDVYLDTPTLIDALGHGGTIFARAARESIVLLREAGATIKCFDHTAVEMDRKLCDVAQQLRDRRKGNGTDPIIDNATARQLTPEDLEQAAGRVRSDLRKMKVTVVEAPAHTPETTINEVEAEKILIGTLKHSRTMTLRFDLDSLAGVYRIRGGRPKYRIESCEAIFATPHGRLLGASRQIFRVGPRNVPVAIWLPDLVTLAWLKKPRAMPDLPRLRIAADCYATVQPSPGLVRRYLEEATKLRRSGVITEDDLYELRYGTESKRILMLKTKGSTSAVDAEVVQSVLDERNRQIEARARTEADRDTNAARAQLAEERTARGLERTELSARISKLEEKARAQDDQLRTARDAENSAIERRTRRLARCIVWPLAAVIFLAAVLVALLTVPYVGDRVAAPVGLRVIATLPHGMRWAVRTAGVIVAAAILVLSLWGWGYCRGVARVESWVHGILKGRALGRAHWAERR